MILAVEGFDMTGKDTLIRRISDSATKPVISYRPEYDLYESHSGITRNDAWVIGHAVVTQLLEQSRIIGNDPRLILNRWIPSGYVYDKLYHHKSGSSEEIMNKYLDILMSYSSYLDSSMSIPIIHVCHNNKSSARIIYEKGTQRSDNEDLDNFEDFEDYWNTYMRAERYYSEFYNRLLSRFNQLRVIRVPNEIGYDPSNIIKYLRGEYNL